MTFKITYCPAIFKGEISLYVPPGREKSGYVAIKSVNDKTLTSQLDPEFFTALEIKVKTVQFSSQNSKSNFKDGRLYVLNATTESENRGEIWQSIIKAPENEWTTVTLPLVNFITTWRGHIDTAAANIVPNRIQSLGILQAQRLDGPFHFEIEYIKALSLEAKKTSKRYKLY